MATNDPPLHSTVNARTLEQYEVMRKAEEAGICIFCDPSQWKNPPILTGKYWWLKKNDMPYKHHQHHLVIVAKTHMTDILDVNGPMWEELGEIIKYAVYTFGMPGGGIAMRFGEPAYNASTIRHFHVHIQVPDLTGPAKATFAKDHNPEDEARRKARLENFEAGQDTPSK